MEMDRCCRQLLAVFAIIIMQMKQLWIVSEAEPAGDEVETKLNKASSSYIIGRWYLR